MKENFNVWFAQNIELANIEKQMDTEQMVSLKKRQVKNK